MNTVTQSSRADLLRQWVTFAAILATFAINVWSNLAPPGGKTIGDISNTLFAPVLVIPANYAFAIWGVIYLGLFAFGIYQLLPAQRHNPAFRRANYWLVLACVAQAIWVFLFLSFQFGWSVLAMLVILLGLIGAYLRLGLGRRSTRRDRWFVDVPFGIYLGWISVATVVNVAVALFAAGWQGGGIPAWGWTVILLFVSAALGAAMLLQRRDLAYAIVIAWALAAIAVRQSGVQPVAVTAAALAVVVLLLVLLVRFRVSSPTPL